jgi:hypothetical protein
MPLLYGEGEMAFIRLQEEIIKDTNDQSILAWSADTNHEDRLGVREWVILAESPSFFAKSGNVIPCEVWDAPTPHAMTSKGLRIEITINLLSMDKTLAVLSCRYEDDVLSILQIRINVYPCVAENPTCRNDFIV